MHIEHVAIWTGDLERLRSFYVAYFGAASGDRYVNPVTRFESYFLTFESGARLELMTRPGIAHSGECRPQPSQGIAHLAVSTGSRASVDTLTSRLIADGFEVVDGPRKTGDGYYESVVLDPDGNRVEITI